MIYVLNNRGALRNFSLKSPPSAENAFMYFEESSIAEIPVTQSRDLVNMTTLDFLYNHNNNNTIPHTPTTNTWNGGVDMINHVISSSCGLEKICIVEWEKSVE